MANPWFRMYSEFMHDLKVQMMTEQDQRRLVMLLCMRCNSDHPLKDEHIAFTLRISAEEWQQTKTIFISSGFLTAKNELINWDKRQFISDSSADRVKKSAHVVGTAERLVCPIEKIVDAYHRLMPNNPVCKIINSGRRAAIKSRWIEASKLNHMPFGYEDQESGIKAWEAFFEVCNQSDFLTGKSKPKNEGDRPFFATIDFLFSPSGFAKCLENKYHAGN